MTTNLCTDHTRTQAEGRELRLNQLAARNRGWAWACSQKKPRRRGGGSKRATSIKAATATRANATRMLSSTVSRHTFPMDGLAAWGMAVQRGLQLQAGKLKSDAWMRVLVLVIVVEVSPSLWVNCSSKALFFFFEALR